MYTFDGNCKPRSRIQNQRKGPRTYNEGLDAAFEYAIRILVKHQHCKGRHEVVSKGESFDVSCLDTAIRELQQMEKRVE